MFPFFYLSLRKLPSAICTISVPDATTTSTQVRLGKNTPSAFHHVFFTFNPCTTPLNCVPLQ